MFLSTIFTSIAALSLGVSAAPTVNAYPRYAQLRLYGEPGCFDQNLGELGVYDERLNSCQTFGDDYTIRSVAFEYRLRDNCTVSVYDDVTCNLNRHDVELGACLSGDKQYGSYLVQC
ncbi:hypothetical protein BDV25DRAFT_58856 [Aspergillus avenaceus]|uniref:Cyanovirin-N domain-containing protein n=1 Tax=Aspergillus avenaceus TaxID=36643 RepID=A0A5N6THX4_ASPAV|nr:hypothetical protein BDV25DRAFT_58856 [Aspergillus avenaceus]